MNNYRKLCEEQLDKMKKAIENGDIKAYDSAASIMEEAYANFKKEESLRYKCTNFGIANHIFESVLPQLFKTNKKAVKEFITTIKEDKNLLFQYMLIESLKRYDKRYCDPKTYLNETLSLAKEKIDVRKIDESNNKLFSIIEKYDLKPSEKIEKDCLSLYESCDYLLKNKKKINNLSEMDRNINTIKTYISENTRNSFNEEINLDNLAESFENSYNETLNEYEKQMFSKIVEGTVDDKKEAFNDLKEMCLNKIDSIIKEEKNSDSFNELKESIKSKEFLSDSADKDIRKMLEILDVLDND